MNVEEAKKQVVKAGKELVKSGLIVRTWGNVSLRINDNTFAITPSGRDYLSLEGKDIVSVNIEDLNYEKGKRPSSEMRMHRAIYREREDVSVIIHTHQLYGSAISAMGCDTFLPYGALEGERIRCSEYARPGTERFSRKVLEALKKTEGNAIILRYHGVVCFGKTYEEVFGVIHKLEKVCRKYLLRVSPILAEAEVQEKLRVTWNDGRAFEGNWEEKEIWNRNPVVMKYLSLKRPLFPFSEDFAQMIGWKAPFVRFPGEDRGEGAILVEGRGALCRGKTYSDAEAVSMLVTKNCWAFFAADAMGRAKPIRRFDVMIMRLNYLKKYSKLKET